jgi:cephalosporin hydroxylase
MIQKFFNTFNCSVNISINSHCSEIELNKWEFSKFIVRKLVPVAGIHPFPLDELMLMATAVVHFRPDVVFDWGTHIGKSARIFYETAKLYKIPLEIHSVDLPEEVYHVEHPHKNRGKMVHNKKNVYLHLGDGVETSLNIYKANRYLNPLFFVDGDHSFDSVYRELTLIVKEVENPVILLHDTFYQSSEAGYNVGPYLAIKQVIAESPKPFKVHSTAFGLPGMTLLYL